MKVAVFVSLVVGLLACGKVQGNLPDANGDDDAPPDPCAAPNVCECEVATEDSDCGVHQFCEASASGRTCECVAGYTRGNDGLCLFTGTVQDSAFRETDKWTPVNGALLNTTAVGAIDPGEASFLPSALCGLAHVRQDVEMPSLRKSEPLVLVLSYRNQIDFNNFDSVLMGVSLGGGWFPLPFFNDANFRTTRLCLPEGGYAPAATSGRGAPVTLAFGPYQKPSRCPNSTVTNFAIDHVSIVKANPGECTGTPGQGINFDAEGQGGWTFTTSGSSSGGFANGLGVGGSRAAQVTLGARCDSAVMATSFDVPSVANPMLEMFVGTRPGTNGTVSFGENLLTMALPSGSSTTLRLCLPPSLRGQTMGMRFSMSGGSGSCAEILNHQVFADNVRVIDDPTCASADGYTNLGFEHAGQAFGSFGLKGSSTADAIVRTSANLAHSGTRYLSLESNGRCSSSGLTLLVTVPAAVGTAGPALTFFANVGNNPDASTRVIADGVNLLLPEGGGYRKHTVCLSPLFTGRPQIVQISHNGGSGLCDNSNYPQQTALIDSIEVTTDPGCAAQ
jgi:hypothetical protein